MRRPGVRIPSRPPSFKTTSSVPNSSYRGTLGLSSLPDSFRYLVIHPERHCLCAASSVNTSRLFPLLIGSSRRQITSVWPFNRNLEGGYGCPVARRLFPQSDTVTFLIAVNEPLNITSASS